MAASPAITPPALSIARAASAMVAPVVTMSSTTMKRLPSSRVRAARVARTFASLPDRLSPTWSARGATALRTDAERNPARRSSRSTCLYPRRRSEALLDGTLTSSIGAPAAHSWSTASIAAAVAGARAPAASVLPASLNAAMTPRARPS